MAAPQAPAQAAPRSEAPPQADLPSDSASAADEQAVTVESDAESDHDPQESKESDSVDQQAAEDSDVDADDGVFSGLESDSAVSEDDVDELAMDNVEERPPAHHPAGYDPTVYREQDVLGDGACMYRAIAVLIFGRQDRWRDVLRALLQAIMQADSTVREVIAAEQNLSMANFKVELRRRYWPESHSKRCPPGDFSILAMLPAAFPAYVCWLCAPGLKPIRMPAKSEDEESKTVIRVWWNGQEMPAGHYKALVPVEPTSPAATARAAAAASLGGERARSPTDASAVDSPGQSVSAAINTLLQMTSDDAEARMLADNMRQRIAQLRRDAGAAASCLLTDGLLDQIVIEHLLEESEAQFRNMLDAEGPVQFKRLQGALQMFFTTNASLFEQLLAKDSAVLKRTRCPRWIMVGDQTAGKSALLEALQLCPIAFSKHGTATKLLTLFRFLPNAVPASHAAAAGDGKDPMVIVQLLDPHGKVIETLRKKPASRGSNRRQPSSASPSAADLELLSIPELHPVMCEFMENRSQSANPHDQLVVSVYLNNPAMPACEIFDSPGFVGDADKGWQKAVKAMLLPFLREQFKLPPEQAPTVIFCAEILGDAGKTNTFDVEKVIKEQRPSEAHVCVALTHSDEIDPVAVAEKMRNRVKSWDGLSQFLFGPVCTKLGLTRSTAQLFLTSAAGIDSSTFADNVRRDGYQQARTEWLDRTEQHHAAIQSKLEEVVRLLRSHGFMDDEREKQVFLQKHVGTPLLKQHHVRYQLKHFMSNLGTHQHILEQLMRRVRGVLSDLDHMLEESATDVLPLLDQFLRAFTATDHYAWTGQTDPVFQPPLYSGLHPASSDPQPSDRDRQRCRTKHSTTNQQDEQRARELAVRFCPPGIELNSLLHLPFRNVEEPDYDVMQTEEERTEARQRHEQAVKEQQQCAEKHDQRSVDPSMQRVRFAGGLLAHRLLATLFEAYAMIHPRAPTEREIESGMEARGSSASFESVFAEVLRVELRRILEKGINPWMAHRFAVIAWSRASLSFDTVVGCAAQFRGLFFDETGKPRPIHEDMAALWQQRFYTDVLHMLLRNLDENTRKLITGPSHNLADMLEVLGSIMRFHSEESEREYAATIRHAPSSVAFRRKDKETKLHLSANGQIPGVPITVGASISLKQPSSAPEAKGGLFSALKRWGGGKSKSNAQNDLQPVHEWLEQDKRSRPRRTEESVGQAALALMDRAIGPASVPLPVNMVTTQPEMIPRLFLHALQTEVRARLTTHQLHVVLNEATTYTCKLMERSDGFAQSNKIIAELAAKALRIERHKAGTRRQEEMEPLADEGSVRRKAAASASSVASVETAPSARPELSADELASIELHLQSFKMRSAESRTPLLQDAGMYELFRRLLQSAYGVQHEQQRLIARRVTLRNIAARLKQCAQQYEALLAQFKKPEFRMQVEKQMVQDGQRLQ